MNEIYPTVVLGLGSSHGDDNFGWSVIDELSRLAVGAELRKIRHPLDILPWLESASHVHVVDAAVGLPEHLSLWQLDFADVADRSRIQELPSGGSHDIGLFLALTMAESLRKPTNHVTFWLGRGEYFEPMSEMSSATLASLKACRETLARRLCDARTISR